MSNNRLSWKDATFYHHMQKKWRESFKLLWYLLMKIKQVCANIYGEEDQQSSWTYFRYAKHASCLSLAENLRLMREKE